MAHLQPSSLRDILQQQQQQTGWGHSHAHTHANTAIHTIPSPPPDIITIADRRIRIAGGGLEDASIYTYCRQWTYNNPAPTFTGPLDEAPRLPPIQFPPPALSTSTSTSPVPPPSSLHEPTDPGVKDLSVEVDFSDIQSKQTERWKGIGAHMRRAAAEKREPYCQRLASVSSVVGPHNT